MYLNFVFGKPHLYHSSLCAKVCNHAQDSRLFESIQGDAVSPGLSLDTFFNLEITLPFYSKHCAL